MEQTGTWHSASLPPVVTNLEMLRYCLAVRFMPQYTAEASELEEF